MIGGPGAGKTTLLDALRANGYQCVPDAARALIKSRLAAGLSPRPEPTEFANNILNADIAGYRNTAVAGAAVFFDRGVVDALGMLYREGTVSEAQIEAHLSRYPFNRTVFLLPPWEEIYTTDSERDQTFAESVAVFESVRSWYGQCGYEPVRVPIGSVAERVRFIETSVSGQSDG